MGIAQISTGIDKLLMLIKEKHTLSLSEASKILGVSSALVEEWANFLEEEQVITMEYKLSGTVLVEKEITQKEINKKEKEVIKNKEALVKNLSKSSDKLKSHSKEINLIKKKYEKVTDLMGSEFDHLKKEISGFGELEKRHDNLNVELIKQNHNYEQRLKEVNNSIKRESKKYNDLILDLKKNDTLVQKQQKEIKNLKTQEELVYKNLEHLHQSAEKIEKSVKVKNKEISDDINKIDILKKEIKAVQSELFELKDCVNSVFVERAAKEKELDIMIKSISKKMMEKNDEIGKGSKKIKTLEKEFMDFISNKKVMKNLLYELESDTLVHASEMDSLIEDANKFDLLSKSNDVKVLAKKMKKRYEELMRNRDKAHQDYDSLASLFR